MRILRLIIFLAIVLLVIDFIITNDTVVPVGMWPFPAEINLSVGLLGVISVLFGILLMVLRSLLMAGASLFTPAKKKHVDKTEDNSTPPS